MQNLDIWISLELFSKNFTVGFALNLHIEGFVNQVADSFQGELRWSVLDEMQRSTVNVLQTAREYLFVVWFILMAF